jgi:photosystem II protein
MGARFGILCVAFAFAALAGLFAGHPSKLFKPSSRGPTGVDARGRGRNLPPPSRGPGAISRHKEERSTPFASPTLAWVPPMVAVCCGMAIGAVAVGLRYPRRVPKAFPMESLQSAAIEFIVGEAERCIPDVKLTRSPDGRVSTAVFTFDSPDILSDQDDGEMSEMHLKDEEGFISTKDVNAQFVNGRPRLIVARVMLNGFEAWDRFMRWMDRYAQANGLAFTPARAQTPASSYAAFTPKSSFSSMADALRASSYNSMGDALTDGGRHAYA